MNKKLLTVIGIVAVAGGSVALYLGGASEEMVISLVGGVTIMIGIVLSFFRK